MRANASAGSHLMRLGLVATGVLSLLVQVVLLRELQAASFGNELVYAVGLGIWLLATGVGALLARWRAPSTRLLGVAFLAVAIALGVAVVTARELRQIFPALPGAYLPLATQLGGALMILVPVGLLLGALFQWPARLFVAAGGTLARAYAIESAGGLGGGILATLLLAAGMRNLTAALLAALLAVAMAAWFLGVRQRSAGGLAALATAIAVLVGLAATTRLDAFLTRQQYPALVADQDSPYGRLTLTRDAGQLTLFVNDALTFDSEDLEPAAFAALALIQRPRPEDLLVLGGGLGGLVRGASLFAPRRIDDVELDRLLFALVLPQMPEPTRAAFANPRVHTIVADPRQFLMAAGVYDAILIGMPEPESGPANRFYTLEFFLACSKHLKPGGVVALRLAGSENLWTPRLAKKVSSVARALHSAFADVVALPGETVVLIGSNIPLARDPAVLNERLAALTIPNPAVPPELVRYLYENDRFGELARLIATTSIAANSDARPLSYHYAMLSWLERLDPALAALDVRDLALPYASRPQFWLVVAAVGLMVLALLQRSRRLRPWALAFVAGFAAMVFESALIVTYQVKNGVLFGDLGLLLAAFMVGLTLGAVVLDRSQVQAQGLNPPRVMARLGSRGIAMAIAVGFALVSAGVAHGTGDGQEMGLGSGLTLLVVAGIFVGTAFAQASRQGGQTQRSLSAIYAADLLGGALGATVTGLMVIPAVGVSAAFALTAFAAVATVALV